MQRPKDEKEHDIQSWTEGCSECLEKADKRGLKDLNFILRNSKQRKDKKRLMI